MESIQMRNGGKKVHGSQRHVLRSHGEGGPVLRSSILRRVERVEGNEGDSVGGTPTGAIGTVALPKGLGCSRLRPDLKLRGVLFSRQALYGRHLACRWRRLPAASWCSIGSAFQNLGQDAPGTGRQDACPTSTAKTSRRRTPRSFQTGSDCL